MGFTPTTILRWVSFLPWFYFGIISIDLFGTINGHEILKRPPYPKNLVAGQGIAGVVVSTPLNISSLQSQGNDWLGMLGYIWNSLVLYIVRSWRLFLGEFFRPVGIFTCSHHCFFHHRSGGDRISIYCYYSAVDLSASYSGRVLSGRKMENTWQWDESVRADGSDSNVNRTWCLQGICHRLDYVLCDDVGSNFEHVRFSGLLV